MMDDVDDTDVNVDKEDVAVSPILRRILPEQYNKAIMPSPGMRTEMTPSLATVSCWSSLQEESAVSLTGNTVGVGRYPDDAIPFPHNNTLEFCSNIGMDDG